MHIDAYAWILTQSRPCIWNAGKDMEWLRLHRAEPCWAGIQTAADFSHHSSSKHSVTHCMDQADAGKVTLLPSQTKSGELQSRIRPGLPSQHTCFW